MEKGTEVITIWADAETAEPIEMEMTLFQGEVKLTMFDFRLDVQLSESLFSLDVPKGYTAVEKELEYQEPSPEDLVEMFRIWTKARGGTFPDAATPGHFLKDCKDVDKGKLLEKTGPKKGDAPEVAQRFGGAIVLLMHPEAHYAGKGVKLGDAKTAVCWYKPKDSQTYKVIYGDLAVKDVAEKDLPTTPEETTDPE